MYIKKWVVFVKNLMQYMDTQAKDPELRLLCAKNGKIASCFGVSSYEWQDHLKYVDLNVCNNILTYLTLT